MLVLSRKLGETILIGNNIRLTIVAIRGNQVRLGFTAPTDVRIRRQEAGAQEPRNGVPARMAGAGGAEPAC